jgi:predicted nuclease with TOPRIM domain
VPIAVALITAGGSVWGISITQKKQQALQMIEVKHQIEMITQEHALLFKEIKLDINRLEQKQDKYNHLQERVFNLERDVSVIQEHEKGQDNHISKLYQ